MKNHYLNKVEQVKPAQFQVGDKVEVNCFCRVVSGVIVKANDVNCEPQRCEVFFEGEPEGKRVSFPLAVDCKKVS